MKKVTEFWDEFLAEGLEGENSKTSFVHLISSVVKAVFTWTTFETVSE